MLLPRPILLAGMALLALLVAPLAPARADEAGYNAAVYLLRQTTQPYRDGRHNTMLRALRQLGDDDLQPLFAALAGSSHAPQRVHGLLGQAEISPKRRIDLAALAELEDDRETVEVLAAAMDDDLIDKIGLAAVLGWEGLSPAVRQAVALRLLSEGGSVDTAPFAVSLEIKLDEDLEAGKMLQYAIGALILAEAGDPAGAEALSKVAGLRGSTADAVLAQLLDGAMRRELKTVGPTALRIAQDEQRGPSLRLLAVQAALRLKVRGADVVWQGMYQNQTEAARKVRLALIALDAAAAVDPALFDSLVSSDQELIRLIAQAGRAIAKRQADTAEALAPLIAFGQPLINAWAVTFCRREEPAYAPDLLEAVIRAHNAGEERNRGRLTEAAIAAVHAMCELNPEQATQRLPALLRASTKPGDGTDSLELLRQRQLLLLGIVRAHSADLSSLADQIGTDEHKDFTTEALRLLARARYGATLAKDEWARISDLVQGVGQMELGLRVQLAWLHLERTGKARQAIGEALK